MVESYESTTTRIALPTSATCTLVQDLLPLYLEGEVSSSSRDLIVEHLGHCERCAGYLAGAQSVRGQLRRDLAQRKVATVASAPEQRSLRLGQRLLVGGMTIALCVIGGLASIGMAHGITIDSTGLMMFGLVVGMGALVMLFIMSSAIGSLKAGRLWQLCAGIGTGIMAGFILSGGPSGLAIFAVPLSLVAIGVVLMAVLAPTRTR